MPSVFSFPVLGPKKANEIKKNTFVISSTLHRDDGSFICFVDNTALAADQVYKKITFKRFLA